MGRDRGYERGLREANLVLARRRYEPLVHPEVGRAALAALTLIAIVSLLTL